MIPKKIFITGTDTGIGKTFISAILTQGLGAKYWKPIQAGNKFPTDTQWIQSICNLPETHFIKERYCLTHPVSPNQAAEKQGIQIQLNDFELPNDEDSLIIEGAGGLLVPINKKHTVLDLIQYFNIPVLIVARSGLGTLNHTLLTLQQLNQKSIPILGIVLNGDHHSDNKKSLELFGKVPILAEIEKQNEIHSECLNRLFDIHFKDLFDHD